MPQTISIHALREEGDEVCGADRRICEISIHALREEGDKYMTHAELSRYISIHALREEGDQRRPLTAPAAQQFLSTPSARRATDSPI